MAQLRVRRQEDHTGQRSFRFLGTEIGTIDGWWDRSDARGRRGCIEACPSQGGDQFGAIVRDDRENPVGSISYGAPGLNQDFGQGRSKTVADDGTSLEPFGVESAQAP